MSAEQAPEKGRTVSVGSDACLGGLTPDERAEFGDIFIEAIDVVRQTRRASTSPIQRRLCIGYNRASRIMDAMERLGLVGPERDYQPREILFT